MSASRSFIDVLVGKLTAYVDASSRPAPSIQTPWWVATLETVPVSAQTASRAYTGHDCHPTRSSTATHGASTTGAPTAVQTPRQPSELTAIELLRRLGAPELHRRSSDADLRSAWRRLLRDCHPDAHPHARESDRIVLNARLRAVIRARDILDAKTSARPVAA